MQFHRALRGLLACAVLALNCGASLAQSPVRDTTPITETCNGGGDQSTTVSYAGPSSLQPGKPERVRVTVRNTSPASTLWFGEQTSVPTRLAAWNSSLQGHNNQVAWDGWECGGYRKDGVGNQRAFISDPTSPDDRCHAPGSVSPPSGERTFDFNITAPLGSSGTVKLSWAMVVEFGGACNGFFPEAWYVDIPVSGPDVRCNTDPGPKPGDSYWLLEVWNNETLDTIVPQDGQRTQDSFPVERRWISSDFATDSTGSVTLPINGGATRLSECAGLAHYTARLTRDVPLRAGTYTLKASADDGVRMTVNGASVFNKWTAPQVIPVDAPETARRTATNDGSYTFVIEYLQASGGGQMNVNWALEGTPTPQPPTLRLDSVNNLNASLSWTSVSGAARYSLKRSQSQGGPYSEVQNVSSTFANDAVGQAGTYYYVVTASVNGVDTGFSNEVPVTFNGTPPPGPPTLRLDGVNGLNASLSWTSVTGATRYSLKRSQTQGGPYSEVQNVSSTFANDTVSGGGTYYYVVTALVNGVNTNLSNEVPVTFSGPPTPQPPRLQLDSVNNLTASLSWTSVTSASRYSLKRSQTQGGPYSEVQNVSSTFANDSVSGGGTYYYVVSAFVNGVNTDFSNEVPVTFSGTPTPQPPRLQLDSVQDPHRLSELDERNQCFELQLEAQRHAGRTVQRSASALVHICDRHGQHSGNVLLRRHCVRERRRYGPVE